MKIVSTVADIQDVNGLWIQDSWEVRAINEALGLDYPAYFMPDAEDGGKSGKIQVYGCWAWMPALTAWLDGPFNYPQ